MGDIVDALVVALRASHASRIAIGHGRRDASRDTATAIAEQWQRIGGEVAALVDWPDRAASWQKAARQLVRPQPDAWVIVDDAAGYGRIVRRLGEQPGWSTQATWRVGDGVLVRGQPG